MCPIFRKDGALIGQVHLCPLENRDMPDWEVGYCIGPAFRGHGYAAEALQAFLPAICEQLQILMRASALWWREKTTPPAGCWKNAVSGCTGKSRCGSMADPRCCSITFSTQIENAP